MVDFYFFPLLFLNIFLEDVQGPLQKNGFNKKHFQKGRAGEPEPGVFSSLEPEPLEKKTKSRSRLKKKSGAGAGEN